MRKVKHSANYSV